MRLQKERVGGFARYLILGVGIGMYYLLPNLPVTLQWIFLGVVAAYAIARVFMIRVAMGDMEFHHPKYEELSQEENINIFYWCTMPLIIIPLTVIFLGLPHVALTIVLYPFFLRLLFNIPLLSKVFAKIANLLAKLIAPSFF